MFESIVRLDNMVELYINSLNRPYLVSFFEFITDFGDFLIVGAVTLLILRFLWKRNKDLIKYFIVALVSNEIFVYLIKKVVGRVRPFGALKYAEFSGSLPSGHSAISIFLYGYICYLIVSFYPKSWRRDIAVLSFSILILLIGFSRLYLNLHYLSDVLAGYLIGLTSLLFLIKSTRK